MAHTPLNYTALLLNSSEQCCGFCWEGQTAFEEMETLVFLFSFSALGILYAMNTIPEFQEPYVILEIGVAVLVIVFLFYFLITLGNPPKDVLFFGNQHNYVYFPTQLQYISK
ncbi:hypothetical protein PAMP_024637 [Pampus punctatissimus]